MAMTTKDQPTAREMAVLYFLVETMGGHMIRVIRPGVGSMLGFSTRRGESFAILDLLEVIDGAGYIEADIEQIVEGKP